MPKADAILQDQDGRPALRFERLLPHPPERIWKALTEPGELPAWHPSPFELEPRVGGTVAYAKSEEWPDMPAGEVTAYEPPRLLGYTWGEDDLRWELRPHDDGCLLILTHSFDDRFKAARDAAGWDVCLAALSTSLAGGDIGREPSEGDELPLGWSELNSAYQERFGISPAEATPPPPRK